MLAYRILIGIGLAYVVGCVPHTEEPAAAPPAATGPAAAAPPATSAPLPPDPPVSPAAVAQPTPENTTPNAESSPAQPANAAATAPPAEAPNANAPQPGGAPVRVAAEAGVGKQGQSLKNESGIMVEAAKAYFNIRQSRVFDIQIPQAMKLFEATEGRKPNSEQEFMEKIVKANNLTLPTLPANDRYVYDVERGELMVEKRR